MKKVDDIQAEIAVIIFNEKGNVLLQKRAEAGLWGVLSGNVQVGETLSEAAVRKAEEEAGIKIIIKKLTGVYSDPVSQLKVGPDGKIIHFITSCFSAETAYGAVVSTEERKKEIAFFHPEKLPEDIQPMHPQWLQDVLSEQEQPFIR
ncbi:NUDIX domain-containing protein [Alkalicoccus halolimnae]|uniref:NUDIX domain-containing protein n=1 Tax=Alkalicoccus halolimnae TaxID=1667239 RepID=A0A5C7FHM7_9BACI|nr:NUDIX domain-containing protein [Alkalicoccus halolimnae]TXF84687.1 NUDIX domain-containing protein [Alkalicoccus halolimnae]